MQAFTTHTGLVATMDRADVDTDQIIPKQFLKRIERTGYGDFLFFDWRYLADGSPDPAFELLAPRFAGASILVARRNFGCGSSPRTRSAIPRTTGLLRGDCAEFRGHFDQQLFPERRAPH